VRTESRWRISYRWVASAAAILLVASLAGGYAWHRHHEAEEREEYLAANLPLFRDMIRVHGGGSDASGFAAVTSPLDDRDALRKMLTEKVGRAVPVPDWRKKGWQLIAAGIGPIGRHAAAELRYQNAGRTILLVSLPATAYSGHEGEEPEPYEYKVDGHAIWGFVKDGGLHCAIGGPGVTSRDVADLKIE
jgi:anti-sigma factor RsiW